MRSMKKCFERVLVVLLAIACVLCSASCNKTDKNHKHDYAKAVTDPTCTANGHAKYTCDCGDTYEETIPALGHAYRVTYEYPTVTTDGSRTYVCERCGYTETSTIHAISANLPKASELLAYIIGDASYSISIEEDSKLVYVTDLSDYDNGKTGVKGFVYFELAEAMISGKGEELVAHLGIKIGETQTELTGLVPAKDVVASGNREIAQVYFYINGDDVSLEVISPNGNTEDFAENLSNVFYDAIGKILGLDYETIAEFSYIASELISLAPAMGQIVGTALNGLPKISPEYVEHLGMLFALVGEDVVVETVDPNGNIVYTVDPAAFKLFLAEIENKTVSEYLASVYGEDIVKALGDFLTSLPNKTIKEIANSAVALVEATDLSIADVYTFIDLLIYITTDVEFCIENEIFSRYDMTLAQVLAELNGIGEDEIADFTAYLNASFENIIQVLGTITIEDVLNSMIYGEPDADVSVIKDLQAMIDMLGEASTVVITVDANGVILSAVVSVGAFEFLYTFDGTETKLTIVNGTREILVTENANGIEFTVKENGVQTAFGSATATETVDGNNVIKTVVLDLRDSKNDLLDCKIEWTNDVITTGDLTIRDYYNEGTPGYYDEDKGIWIPGETYTYLHDVFDIEYLDDGIGSKSFTILVDDVTYYLTYVEGNGSMTVTAGGIKRDDTIGSAAFGVTEVVVDNDTTVTVTADLKDSKNDLLDLTIVSTNGTVTAADVTLRGYVTEYENMMVYDPTTDSYVPKQVATERFDTLLVLDYDDDMNGTKNIVISADDEVINIQSIETMEGVTVTYTMASQGEVYATVKYAYSIVTVGEDTTLTLIYEQGDGENILLDYSIVFVNGVLTEVSIISRGYEYVASDNLLQVEERNIVTLFELQYKDNGDGTKDFVMKDGEDIVLVAESSKSAEAVELTLSLTDSDELIASGKITVTDKTLSAVIDDGTNKFLDLYLELNEKKDALVKANVEINDYFYEWDEVTESEVKVLVTLFDVGFEVLESANGMESIRVEYMGMVLIFVSETTEDGFVFTVYDGVTESVYFSFGVSEKNGSVTVESFAATPAFAILAGAVTVTETVTDEATVIVIDIDLDHLLLQHRFIYDIITDPNTGEEIWTPYALENYVEFDGAIKITIA